MNKKRVVGFELKPEEIEKLNEVCKKTGLKRVELFRQRVLEADTISKQFLNLQNEFESKIDSAIESLDNSIEWYVNNHLEDLDSKIENGIKKSEDRIVEKVIDRLKDIL